MLKYSAINAQYCARNALHHNNLCYRDARAATRKQRQLKLSKVYVIPQRSQLTAAQACAVGSCHGLVAYYIAGMKTKSGWFLCGLLAVVFGTSGFRAYAGEPTAFDLIKEGNRYVGEQCKDKIVQLRSEKSIGSLTPNIWHIVYYDPTATLKATEVTLEAGKMKKVGRPWRLLEPATGGDVPLERSKLKVDSDQAIKLALKEPLLENIKATATELNLMRVGEGVLGQGGTAQPVWKVKLWAAKLRNPSRDADIGEVWISADDGKLVKSDLHLNRLD